MNALFAVLLTLPLPSADPCADVFDRTAQCAAVDAEALPAPVDPVPALEPERDDVGMALSWSFLAGSAATAVAAGAAGVGAFLYDAQLAALYQAGAATPDAVDDLLLQRGIAQIGAGSLLLVSGLLAGTSVAFLIFNPEEGRPREAFRIEE